MEIEKEFIIDLLYRLSDDRLTSILDNLGIRHHSNVDWNKFSLVEKIIDLIERVNYEERLSVVQKGMTEAKSISYQDYLNSDRWKSISERHKEIFSRCMICGVSENLNVHHNTYDHIGYEYFDDLVTLCKYCRAKFPDKLPKGVR